MPSNINTLLGRLTQSQLDTITYEAGVDANGAVSTASFNTWFNNAPLDIPGPAIGTGITVTFGFDPGSGFTATQQAYMAQSLAIWSGLANINFTYTATPASATLLFLAVGKSFNGITAGTSGTSESTQTKTATSPGINQVTQAFVQIDNGGNYGDIGSYSVASGYGISTLVHEVGHFLGLGHTGPYNGTANPATQQNNSTDVRTWSTMSYIDPSATNAKYYATENPTGASTDYGNGAPLSPMGLDVFAAQRLMGAPTSTMFSGGQTFGFNSNIKYTAIDGSQQILSMYDFTVDTTPIVTLYDYGANNTLDLSGYSTSSTINLNDGTFSSAGGLKNNIFIEYGIAINSVVGGSGDDSFTVNNASDTVNGGGGTNVAIFSNNRASYAASYNNGTYTLTIGAVVDTLTNIQSFQFADQTVSAAALACFLRGTLIATPAGEVAVEALRIGDRILTEAGEPRAITWLGFGRTLVTPRNLSDAAPVIVRAGALGTNSPARDLYVTRHHALRVGDVLVPAEHLINGISVLWDERPRVIEYYHIELETHDILIADGAPAESFRDDGNGHMFQNAINRRIDDRQQPCREVVEGGKKLDQAWRQVASRASKVPANVDQDDPDLHLIVDGQRIEGQRGVDSTWSFDLPTGFSSVAVASHTVIPATGGDTDRRRLGVAVREMTMWRHNMGHKVDFGRFDHGDGWHEMADGHRWTKGVAYLTADAVPGPSRPTRLEIALVAAKLRYRRPLPAAAA